MSNNLIIKIEPADFGIDESRAAQVKAFFLPMLDKMERLETELNAIKAVSEVTPEVCKAARELRLKYKEVRCGTDKIHKELKSFYLNGGRFVDSWKNAQKAASEGREQELDRIERHFEIIEDERRAKLELERWSLLHDFVDPLIPKNLYNLSGMTEEVFKNFLAGAKETWELKKEAEAAAIEAKKKAEHDEMMKQMQLKIENERLKKEQEVLQRKQQEQASALRDKERTEKELTEGLEKERAKNAQLQSAININQDKSLIHGVRGDVIIIDDPLKPLTDSEILTNFLNNFNDLFEKLPKLNVKIAREISEMHGQVCDFLQILIKENERK
jgi:hypothetical protein